MDTALTDSNGIATEIGGIVAHVVDNPVKPSVQQVLGPDPLMDAAHVIENLKCEEAAFANMHALMLDQALNWFQIGGTLLQMKENGWFADHVSFAEMTWSEFGFKKSKAYHLINIYKTLLDAGLSWNEVEELGWPKMRLICTKAVSAKFDHEQFSKILKTAKALKYVELEASLRAEFMGRIGFGKVCVDPKFPGGLDGAYIRLTRDHHERHIRIHDTDLTEKFETCHPRHLPVAHD